MQPIPLIRLGNLFPKRQVFAKCEFLGASGSFKIRGANHLLTRLSSGAGSRLLVVPSMGNTALGAATAAREFGFAMIGVVSESISKAKDEKLRALGVELIKIDGGGSVLLAHAEVIARERGGYFVHPHLDPAWTDGYQAIAAEILEAIPDCRSLVMPLGGGGLLMGVTEYLQRLGANRPKLFACEPRNYPKYASGNHERTTTIADGLLLEKPHAIVQERIKAAGVTVPLIEEVDIRAALKGLFEFHALVVEPSGAVAVAYITAARQELEEPICVILTGGNIAREDFDRHIRGV